MTGPVRASLAAALALLAIGSAPAAAQQRACTAADSARVAWSPPPGVDDQAWRATLLANGLVTPETELVRVAYDSLPPSNDTNRDLLWELLDVVQARAGDGAGKFVILKRVEPDSSLSRLLLALPSGMVGIGESISEKARRLRFAPVFRDGCPMAVLYPIVMETSGTQRIPAAQAPPRGAAASEWVNVVTIDRLRDEFAARPAEASLRGIHPRGWTMFDRPVTLPEPFRSRAFVAESYVLLDVDSAGHAAGCRPLRAGAHPELDALGCTLLMRPGAFSASIVPTPTSQAGRWVLGLRWESLTAAAHRERRAAMQGTYELSPPPPPPSRPDSSQPRPGSSPSPGGRWVKAFQYTERMAAWIDTASVRRVRGDFFRFTLRVTQGKVSRRQSDGLEFDQTDDPMELDCATGQGRSLGTRLLLGERVVDEEEAVPGQNVIRPSPRYLDGYCRVLREARP